MTTTLSAAVTSGARRGGSPGGEADNSQLQAPAHDSSARRDDGGLVGGWQDHSPGDEPETAPAEIRHVVERQAYQGPLPLHRTSPVSRRYCPVLRTGS